MKEIKFNKELLNVVNDLTKISPKILFVKGENKNEVKMKSRGISFGLSFNAESFDFDGTELAFIEYSKFHNYLEQFLDRDKDTKLFQTDDFRLKLESPGRSLKFRTSDPTIFEDCIWTKHKRNPNEIFDFVLKRDDFNEIKSLCRTMSATTIKLKITKNNLIVSIYEINQDSFDRTIEIDKVSEIDIEVIIKSDLFKLAPAHDYTMKFCESKIIKMFAKNELYSLGFMTGEKLTER